MRSAGLTGKLARTSARHPWKIVAIWMAVLLIGLTTMVVFGNRFAPDEDIRADLENLTADGLITERLNDGQEAPAQEFVIVSSDSLTVDDPAFETVVASVAGQISAHNDLVSGVATYYETGQENLVSFDRQRTIIVTTLAGDPQDAVVDAIPVIETINDLHEPAPGFEVLSLGEASIAETLNTTAEEGILLGESIGIIIALVVMAVVFGTLVAAGLPILLTLVALLITVSIAMGFSHFTSLNFFVTNMIFMIGLAVGIDYALFIISRYREEREHGLDIHDAITRAGNTSTKAVLFSGLTVVISLAGMLIVPWNILTSLGAGAILVVTVSVLMTLTLLPAVLSLLGDRINRGSIPFIGYQQSAATRSGQAKRGFWNWISGTVMRRPVVSLIGSAGLLILLGSFAFTLSLGNTNLTILPESSEPVRAYTIFQNEFPGSDYQPATIVVEADDVTTPETRQAVDSLIQDLENDPFFGEATIVTAETNNLVRIDVAMNGVAESNLAIEAVERLRNDYIPPLFDPIEASAYVTGDTAYNIDVSNLSRTYLPIVFGFVLTISFVLLLLAFRSIIVPIKAIAMNLLSVFAAYGLLALVFQKGVGADLLGFRQVERVDAFIPLVLFTMLFGLSMDYHVFLLSRIKEQFDLTGNNEQSVAAGLRTTGRLITGAALIMVGVFGGFAAADLTAMQQFGFGLAVAIIIDATIVRMILVPASMVLLGNRNWYLPSWLSWIPDIHIEGSPVETDSPSADQDGDGLVPEPTIAD